MVESRAGSGSDFFFLSWAGSGKKISSSLDSSKSDPLPRFCLCLPIFLGLIPVSPLFLYTCLTLTCFLFPPVLPFLSFLSRGVYCILLIFLPPSPFQNDIFPPFFHLFPLKFAVFLNHHLFFPQPTNNSYFAKWKIYTPASSPFHCFQPSLIG